MSTYFKEIDRSTVECRYALAAFTTIPLHCLMRNKEETREEREIDSGCVKKPKLLYFLNNFLSYQYFLMFHVDIIIME